MLSFSYAMLLFPLQGVERCIAQLKEEFSRTMSLMGVSTVAQIGPSCVDASSLGGTIGYTPPDAMFNRVYVPLASKL